ncbi:hypothetical protein [Acetobacter sp. DsW_54]|uniref:hypothetical protein n=1 Tax=Acetobacter sp. DsW_54 TaxID=1670660 RepID=UPI000A36A671|nr:hypothetical protein [Acetobacter sp. DsW_54]OUI99755.1 hypothetical protein HK20_01535 [Acetobacter sp. DsW_54]
MPILFYLLLLGGILAPVAHTMADTLPKQTERTALTDQPHGGSVTADALNAQSLAHIQRAQPVQPAATPALPDGTIAKGTGVMAPDLQEAPIYNPADRR